MCNHLLKALLLLQPLFLRLSLLLLIVPHGRLREPLVLPDLSLDGVDQLGALDGAEQHHLSKSVSLAVTPSSLVWLGGRCV